MNEYKRLSESFLWDYQQQFYIREGIAAWQTVPYYVTSNPLIAKSFANVIMGYLRDILSLENSQNIDFNLPIYIVELGTGTGRFSFYFLKHFFENINLPLLSNIKIVYVVTDIVSKNVEYCQSQQCFTKYIANGQMDFAVFDVIADQSIHLINSNAKITKNANNNPIIFISNYVFDSMRNDLFMIDNAILSAAHIALNQDNLDLFNDASFQHDFLNNNQLSFNLEPIDNNYYTNPLWNSLLSLYKGKCDQGTFLFPIDALTAINNMFELTHHKCLILSADRGHSEFTESLSSDLSKIGVHGSISLEVNFYLLAQFVTAKKGLVKQIKRYENGINFALFVINEKKQTFPETLQSFNDWIAHFNSYDFLKIKKLLERIGNAATLDEILAIFQLSHWDQKIFAILLQHLKLQLFQLDDHQKNRLRQSLDNLIEWFYPNEDEIELFEELQSLQKQLSI